MYLRQSCTLCTACKCSFLRADSDWWMGITWATLGSDWSSRHYEPECEAAPACSLFHTHSWSGCIMSSSDFCHYHHQRQPHCRCRHHYHAKLKIQDIDQTWLQNLDQDSTSLPLQNISSKILNKLLLQILPELQLQNNDQTLCSKSEQKFNFMTKPPLPYLQQAVANTILIINISNNKNLNKF